MCKWVNRMWMCRTDESSVVPRRRMPVPASRTSTVPSGPRTPTQEVLPPYRAVSGPGVASDPRVPQSVTSMSDFPEDAHRAEEDVFLADERECRHAQMLPLAVRTLDPYRLGQRSALREHAHHRSIFRRNGLAVVVQGGQAGGPFSGRNFSGFVKALMEDRFRRLVVEDQRTHGIDEQDGRGNAARELPRQDDLDRLRGRHASPLPPPDIQPTRGGRVPPRGQFSISYMPCRALRARLWLLPELQTCTRLLWSCRTTDRHCSDTRSTRYSPTPCRLLHRERLPPACSPATSLTPQSLNSRCSAPGRLPPELQSNRLTSSRSLSSSPRSYRPICSRSWSWLRTSCRSRTTPSRRRGQRTHHASTLPT